MFKMIASNNSYADGEVSNAHTNSKGSVFSPLEQWVDNEKILKELYAEDVVLGKKVPEDSHQTSSGKSGISAIMEQSNVNYIKDASFGHGSQEAQEKWSNSKQSSPMQPTTTKRLPSLEQIRIMKEQQKIRDFFSQPEEERDGINISAAKLPLVAKNLRFQQKKTGGKSKQPNSLVTRDKRDTGTLQNSLFSENSVSVTGSIKNSQLDGPSDSIIQLSSMLQQQHQIKKIQGRYQTIVNQQNEMKRQLNASNSQTIEDEVNTMHTYQPLLGGTIGQASMHSIQPGLSQETAGNYDFASTSLIGKNSIDSLTQRSLLQEQLRQVKLRSLKKILRKDGNNYSVSLMQPIKLEVDSSIVTSHHEYSQQEPVIRTTNERSKQSLAIFKGGPKQNFNSNQNKLYLAVKQQQLEQSRQIVNDQLVPINNSHNHAALEDTYKQTFQLGIGAGSRRLREAYSQNSHSQSLLTRMPFKTIEDTSKNMFQNISTRDDLNINILLKDQFSSSVAKHPPGSIDPLEKLSINYGDVRLRKATRMETQLASLKIKRRTQFHPIPLLRSISVQQKENLKTLEKMLPGGHSQPKKIREDEREMFVRLKSMVEQVGGEKYREFEPIHWTTQVVDGTNFWVKARTDIGYVHFKVFRPLPHTQQPPQLLAVHINQDKDAPFNHSTRPAYFIQQEHMKNHTIDHALCTNLCNHQKDAFSDLVMTPSESLFLKPLTTEHASVTYVTINSGSLERKPIMTDYALVETPSESLKRKPVTIFNEKFDIFKNKLKKSIEEEQYHSESQNSEEAERLDEGQHEEERNEELFFKKLIKLQTQGTVSILKIIQKEAKNREQEERDHLVCHLKCKVPFFKDYSKELITTLCEKLETRVFEQKTSLMDQGEVGDQMFIIYSGECGMYIFDERKRQEAKHKPVAILGANTVVGEKAVINKFDSGEREATVLAHTDVVTLVLSKQDYQKTMYTWQIMEKQRRFEFLAKIPFFKNWDRVNLVDFNNVAEDLKVIQGTTIYDIGMDAQTVYIVRKGKLIMETIIEIDSYFRYPVEKQTWEVRKTTRQIKYKLQDMWKGAIFGHEEYLQGFNRRCRVRALTDCTLIQLNVNELENRLTPNDKERLVEGMRNLDLDYIVKKINRFYLEKSKRNVAVLDSAKVNCHDFSGARTQFMQNNNQSKIQKMLPWINKARKNSTKNQNLLHELRKVTLLSKKEEKFPIKKGDDPETVPSDEFLETKHARFVISNFADDEDNFDISEVQNKGFGNIKSSAQQTPVEKRGQSSNLTMLKRQSNLAFKKMTAKISHQGSWTAEK